MYPDASLQMCCTTPEDVAYGMVIGAVVVSVVVVDDVEVVAVVAPGTFPKNPVEPPAYGLVTCVIGCTVTMSPDEHSMLL